MAKRAYYFIEPTPRAVLSLKRYVIALWVGKTMVRECPIHGIHQAAHEIDEVDVSEVPKLHEGKPLHGDYWPHDDKRWPTHCECGYQFVATDVWEFSPDVMHRRQQVLLDDY